MRRSVGNPVILAKRLGKQYAALTEKACQKIKILDEHELSENDRDKLKKESEANRSKGIEMANEICRKKRFRELTVIQTKADFHLCAAGFFRICE